MKPKRHPRSFEPALARSKSKLQDRESRPAEARTLDKSQSANRDLRTEIVLLAVTGMSPAILTETIWALATDEKTPVVADRVVVVTTKMGKAGIEQELFSASDTFGGLTVWETLRAQLCAKGIAVTGKMQLAEILVFKRSTDRGLPVELEDIRTKEDNEAAADFLLDKLREFAENDDVRLICSLAGGRKTMGALLYACLSLLGREEDRLTHVLVNEPFDDPRLQPRFYFPTTPPTTHRSSTASRTVSSSSARIELADVPFVPLRRLFPKELGRKPGRFMNLVAQYRAAIEQLAEPPRVELSDDEPVVRIEAVAVKLPATAFALFSFLVDRARHGEPPYGKQQEALDPFRAWLARWRDGRPAFDFRHDDGVKNLERTGTEENLRKLVNTLKTRFHEAGIPPAICQHLIPQKGRFGVRVSK